MHAAAVAVLEDGDLTALRPLTQLLGGNVEIGGGALRAPEVRRLDEPRPWWGYRRQLLAPEAFLETPRELRQRLARQCSNVLARRWDHLRASPLHETGRERLHAALPPALVCPHGAPEVPCSLHDPPRHAPWTRVQNLPD